MNILDEIVGAKRLEIAKRKRDIPLDTFRDAGLFIGPRPGFKQSIRAVTMGLIAEVKRRSPSAGPIREPMDVSLLAQQYERGGASALSVLLDEKYFGGGEFVIDEWQVWRAAYLGASVVLLIVAALSHRELVALLEVCREAGVESLVEVHNEAEMCTAGEAGATCIGINNRDLKTFTVSIDTTLRLKDGAPDDCMLISESGIRSADDVMRLQREGIHGVLVGEHLLRQPDIEEAVRSLMGDAWACS